LRLTASENLQKCHFYRYRTGEARVLPAADRKEAEINAATRDFLAG
jgi:hypothetical protein